MKNRNDMDASVYVRKPNTAEYTSLGVKKFQFLPRMDEFISADLDGGTRFFQVIGLHHATANNAAIEVYAVQTDPPWTAKKGRAIGFEPHV